MFKHYVKTAWRNLNRNRIFSIINIFGLGVGLACSMLILLYVKDETSFDKFLKNVDNIYRVIATSKFNGEVRTSSITGTLEGPRFTQNVPGIKAFVRFQQNDKDVKNVIMIKTHPKLFMRCLKNMACPPAKFMGECQRYYLTVVKRFFKTCIACINQNNLIMNNNTIFLFFGAVCICFTHKSYSQDTAAQTYNLQQCIDMAVENNPNVKQYEFTLESDKVNKQQAVASMLPGISGSISRSIYNGKSINPYTNSYINQQNTADNYGLNASIVLWHGSSIMNFVKQNSLAYEAGKMDLQNVKDQITINVILAYLSVLSEQEQLKMAKQQVIVTQEQANRLTIENNKGNISPSDLYSMRGQLGSNEIAVLNTQNALTAAKLNLVQLMTIPYADNMQLMPIQTTILAPYNGTVDAIYRYALAHLPVVKAAELHDESAKRAVKSARGDLFPTLSLFGGMATNYSSAATTSQLINTSDQQTNNYVMLNNSKLPVYAPEFNYSLSKVPYGSQWKNNLNSNIGLNLSIPILNGLQARGRVKLSKIAEAQTAFQQQTVKIQLYQAIERDFVTMTTSYETYKKLVQQVADYSESFREAKIKFEAGAINSVDFVIAENNMNQAALSLIAAKYNYILQTKILDYYRGKLEL